jgi:hypothetical protein
MTVSSPGHLRRVIIAQSEKLVRDYGFEHVALSRRSNERSERDEFRR